MAAAVIEKRHPLTPPGEDASPHADPVTYLHQKGWKCLGNPEWPSAYWLDPTQPLTSYYSREPCMYDAAVREQYRDPVDGVEKVRYTTERRQILCQDGRVGQQQLAMRDVFHPKVTPILLSQALLTQLERDAVEQQRRMAEAERKK